MSATDELRRMLDERGVEWWEAWDKDLTIFDGAHGVRYMADHTLGEWFIRSVLPITAEQAIAATLGGGTCECVWNEQDGTFRCSSCDTPITNEISIEWPSYKVTPIRLPNYCPNCGARVEVAE